MYTEHPTSPSQSTEPSAGTGFSASNVSATAPGQLRVIKRNGTVVSYDVSKISVAMTKAFLAVEGDTAAVSGRVHETVRSEERRVGKRGNVGGGRRVEKKK